MDANKLHEVIIKNDFTMDVVSDLLGLTMAHAYRKINNVKLLTIGEVILLKEFLELTNNEAIEIFLGA